MTASDSRSPEISRSPSPAAPPRSPRLAWGAPLTLAARKAVGGAYVETFDSLDIVESGDEDKAGGRMFSDEDLFHTFASEDEVASGSVVARPSVPDDVRSSSCSKLFSALSSDSETEELDRPLQEVVTTAAPAPAAQIEAGAAPRVPEACVAAPAMRLRDFVQRSQGPQASRGSEARPPPAEAAEGAASEAFAGAAPEAASAGRRRFARPDSFQRRTFDSGLSRSTDSGGLGLSALRPGLLRPKTAAKKRAMAADALRVLLDHAARPEGSGSMASSMYLERRIMTVDF